MTWAEFKDELEGKGLAEDDEVTEIMYRADDKLPLQIWRSGKEVAIF